MNSHRYDPDFRVFVDTSAASALPDWLNLNIPIYSTNMFTYTKKTNCFVAEASDFRGARNGRGGFLTPLGRQGTDVGFWLQSAKTKTKILMVKYEDIKDPEEGTVGWKFRTYNLLNRGNQKNIEAVIFND